MTTMYSYQLDPAAAKQADGSAFITRTGKYIGVFTKAEHVISDKGTVGVAFDFKTEQDEQASFTLYTRREDGSTIFGYNQLHAIMGCLRLRELTEPKNKMANVWDKQENKRMDKPVLQFLELLDKPIGLLIQMEEYATQSGDYKWRPNLLHAFCAKTELMASEILEKKTEPQRLEKCIQKLADKPVKDKGKPAPFNPQKPQPHNELNPPPADYDDDLPF